MCYCCWVLLEMESILEISPRCHDAVAVCVNSKSVFGSYNDICFFLSLNVLTCLTVTTNYGDISD